MDAGLAVRTAVTTAGSYAQPAVAVASTAPTELPSAQTVSPVAKDEAARNDPNLTAGDSITRDAIIDPNTSEVVYRILDTQTHRVVHQEPDRAMLRQMAYVRAKAACALASGANVVDATQRALAHIDTVM